MNSIRRFAVIGLIGCLGVAGPVVATPVGAAVIGCGSTITANTTLQHDIGPCTGPGLIIGASNITLDLNGHRVSGTPGVNDGTGIQLINRSSVTVRNGTVSHFDIGVQAIVGIDITFADLLVIDNVGQAATGVGVDFSASRGSKLLRSYVARNGPTGGVLLFSFGSSNLLEGNTIVDNNIPAMTPGLPPEAGGIGVFVQETVTTTIRNNLIARNGRDGIRFTTNSFGNLVENNRIYRNGFHNFGNPKGDGIQVGLSPVRRVPDPFPAVNNSILNNQVLGNAGNGIVVANKANTIAGNTSQGNAVFLNAATGPAYDLHDRNSNYINCDSNAWTANVFGTAFPVCAAG